MCFKLGEKDTFVPRSSSYCLRMLAMEKAEFTKIILLADFTSSYKKCAVLTYGFKYFLDGPREILLHIVLHHKLKQFSVFFIIF